MARHRLGCSGWSYDDWRGSFYPVGTPPGEYLARYARVFDTVEVDSTFYGIPTVENASRWVRETPHGFLFCPKLSGEITHEAGLAGVEAQVDEYFAALEPLRSAGKLGPVLAQFGPAFRREHGERRLADFLGRVPRGIRIAVELRHRGWWDEAVYALLREHGAALTWSLNDEAPSPRVRTTDFLYARAIGDRALTRFDRIQRDRTGELEVLAQDLKRAEPEVETTYILLNNHFMGFGPGTARVVAGLLHLAAPDLTRAGRDETQRGLGEFG